MWLLLAGVKLGESPRERIWFFNSQSSASLEREQSRASRTAWRSKGEYGERRVEADKAGSRNSHRKKDKEKKRERGESAVR